MAYSQLVTQSTRHRVQDKVTKNLQMYRPLCVKQVALSRRHRHHTESPLHVIGVWHCWSWGENTDIKPRCHLMTVALVMQ